MDVRERQVCHSSSYSGWQRLNPSDRRRVGSKGPGVFTSFGTGWAGWQILSFPWVRVRGIVSNTSGGLPSEEDCCLHANTDMMGSKVGRLFWKTRSKRWIFTSLGWHAFPFVLCLLTNLYLSSRVIKFLHPP